MSTAADSDDRPNPFPGLRPFREAEEYLFFGRESQVDSMVDKLATRRFLAVVGTSGSGKSSLVNCGLRPALRGGLMADAGTAWRMAQFRPGNDPLTAMARALAEQGVLFSDHGSEGMTLAEIIETTLRMSTLGLIDIFEQAQLGKGVNLLIVVDQFEELFRFRQLQGGHADAAEDVSEAATAFVNLLLAARAQTTHPIHIVLTMRSDFLGDCTHFAGLAEAINEGQYLVPRLTRDERRAAISGPVGVGGAEIAPVLLTRLVNDVGHNPDQLSILQHALNRTWAHWQNEGGGRGPLDLTHYEAIGSMAKALDKHAEKAFGELDKPRQRRICEKLFKALTDKATDPRGVRRPTTMATLCALAEAPAAEVTEVIDVFRRPSRSFLMPPAEDPLEPTTVIDISHETLMRVWQRLNKWADEEARSAETYFRVAETAKLYADGKASLWRDPDLQLALAWRDRTRPNETWAARYNPGYTAAMDFLEQSRAARDAEARRALRIRRLVAVVSASALLIMAAMVWAMAGQWRKGLKAESAFLADVARQQIAEGDPVTGELLALEALQDRNSGNLSQILRPFVPAAQGALDAATLPGTWRDKVLAGHAGEVWSVEISADGSRVLTRSFDESARLWDAATGREIVLEGMNGANFDVVWSSDGSRILTNSGDGTASLWSLAGDANPDADGGPVKIKDIGTGYYGSEFSPDGTRFVTDSSDGTRLWDAADGSEIVLEGHDATVSGMTFSRDGTRILAGSDDGTVSLWRADGTPALGTDGKPIVLVGQSPAFSGDGTRIVTDSDDGTAHLWDSVTGDEMTFGDQDHAISKIRVSPDGNRILTDFENGTTGLWSVPGNAKLGADGLPIKVKDFSTPFPSLEFSPDSKRLMASSDSGTLRLWNAITGDEIALETYGTGSGFPVFSPDGRRLLDVFENDNTVQLWNSETGKLVQILEGHTDDIQEMQFSANSRFLVTASYDGTARLWNAASGKLIQVLGGHDDPVGSIAISRDGARIVTSAEDNTARIWQETGPRQSVEPDAASGEEIFRVSASDGARFVTSSYAGTAEIGDIAGAAAIPLIGHQDLVLDAAFSPDDTRVVTGSLDGTARLWDAATGKELWKFTGHEGPVGHVAFAPNGARIVTASDDGTARIWDAVNGEEVKVLRGHSDWVTDAGFSPDGTRIVTTSKDATGRLWDANGDPVLGSDGQSVVLSQGLAIQTFEFSPDGARFVTVDQDRDEKLWVTATGEPVNRYNELDGHGIEFDVVAFFPDGSRIVTGSADNTARIWDARTGERLAVLNHLQEVLSVEVAKDNASVLTSSVDDTARLWDAASGAQIAEFRRGLHEFLFAEFSKDGAHIVGHFEEGPPEQWDMPKPIEDLIEASKNNVSRCLTQDQRKKFHLTPNVPRWCYEKRKWPYDDPDATPPPSRWYAQPLVAVAAWIMARRGDGR